MRIVWIAVMMTTLLWGGQLRETVLQAGMEPIPQSLQQVIEKLERPDNPITEEKIALGKMLYFDPRLSKSGIISCNTCHNIGLGGVDGIPAAIGHNWQVNPVGLNSPTVFNAAFHIAQFHDGRSPHLADQASGPIQADVEMAISREMAEARFRSIPEYVTRFESVFRGEPEPVTLDNIAKAIAAFEMTLVTPSRFDAYMHGDTKALSRAEKKGLEVFIQKECITCHNGVGLGGGMMRKFPEVGKFRYAHIGTFRGDAEGRTRVPTLRNLTLTAPYFHNGSVWSIEEAIEIMAEAQLGIHISRQEVGQIAAFLRSLEGEQPQIVIPMLPRSRIETPRPLPFESD